MAIAQPPSIVIAELTLPGFDGVKLARVIRMRDDLSGVPVLLLSLPADAAARRRALRDEVDEVLIEPVDLEELHLRAQRTLRRAGFKRPVTHFTALRGRLEQFGAASVLGLLELDRKTGLLKVTEEDGQVATLYLRRGEVVQASLSDNSAEGADVVYLLARWVTGNFAFKDAPVEVEDSIGLPTQLLIIEAARRIDEEE